MVPEVERLLLEAMSGFASAPDDFTIVAVPSGSTPDRPPARVQHCEDDSSDIGRIRDGTFYWPLSSILALGTATIVGYGQFAFVAFDRDLETSKLFSEFSGRAAAALLAAAPPWVALNRPGPGITTWPATIMFISPTARIQTVKQSTGAHILRNPWAASIAALRDILKPPAPVPPSQPVKKPVWDPTARVLSFKGDECKRFRRTAPDQETILVTFQEDGWPGAIDDPLAPGKLATTVESLNRRLKHIRFGLNGAGTGVCWRPV